MTAVAEATAASISMARVTAARAFRRAGIGFAAGVTELDLLDLTAAQIIAIANEPALVMEGRLFGDDEWQVFPVPTDIDLPLLEAELQVAKQRLAEARYKSPEGEMTFGKEWWDEHRRPDADPGKPVATDQTAAADAPANTDTTQSEGAVTPASADVAPAETEAGATSAPASGTKPTGKATK